MTRYRILTPGINYPTDPQIIERLLAGENIPFAERGEIESHVAGNIVSNIPECSIADLLENGDIEIVEEAQVEATTVTASADAGVAQAASVAEKVSE